MSFSNLLVMCASVVFVWCDVGVVKWYREVFRFEEQAVLFLLLFYGVETRCVFRFVGVVDFCGMIESKE